jgi:cytochrome P450
VLGDRLPHLDDLARLSYARMIFEEALRLYPTEWTQPREAVQDDLIQGFVVPQGTVVLLAQYITHRHPAFWDRPEEFNPGRFAPESRAFVSPFAYFPFGGGPHTCIGRAASVTIGPLVLAVLARHFTVRLTTDLPDAAPKSFFLNPSRPLLASISVHLENANPDSRTVRNGLSPGLGYGRLIAPDAFA